MKILTKEEERDHYNATIKGGIMGGAAGVGFGALGVLGASRRYPAFRSLTLPFRAFLIASTGTFASIVAADSYSRRYEASRNPEKQYQDESQSIQEQLNAGKSTQQRTMEWLGQNRYSIVFGSWVASMGAALGIVGRNPYLTGQQKLVQARVYAQGLTLAVVIISLAFETTDSATGKGRWETIKIIDPKDPEHKHVIEKKIHHERYAGEDQWRDMVDAEEERMKEREAAVKKRVEADQKKDKKKKEAEKREVEKEHKGNPEEGDKRVRAP